MSKAAYSSNIRLDKQQARKLLSEIVSKFVKDDARIILSGHFLQRCEQRNVSTGDVMNVLQRGKIMEEPEQHEKTGAWIYCVETDKFEVEIEIVSLTVARCLTAKRRDGK
jgi:ABC-type cobalamin transport system ATPase subunit